MDGDWEGLGGVSKKPLNRILFAYRPHDYADYESVALMVSEKHCLDMTDRQTDEQTDMAKSIFLVALIKNIYI